MTGIQRFMLDVYYLCILMQMGSTLKFIDIQQWCFVDSVWVPYNSSSSTCFDCGGKSRLYSISEAAKLVCCYTGAENTTVTRKECQFWPRGEIGRACENGHFYYREEECDTYNDCGDGSDEKVCDECLGDFRCASGDQCFGIDKVCDGTKHCSEGTDETNCAYHKGRCLGFLCSLFQECIPMNKICNQQKDCLDGSDEYGCKKELSFDNFFCNNSFTIPALKVCNGIQDCINRLDEDNCFIWGNWGLWSSCGCPNEFPVQKRTRQCIGANLTYTPGECGMAENAQNKTCVCPTPTTTTAAPPVELELQWIILIALASAVLLLSTIGLIYGGWFHKQTKDVIEKQAAVVATIYNNSTSSMSPRPMTVNANQGFEFSNGQTGQASPSTRVQSRRDPLPLTPIQAINHTYESIENLREKIDPYAQTSVGRTDLVVIEEAESSDEDGQTIVETYRTEDASRDTKYVKTPPPIPSVEKSFEKDGYLLPTSISMKFGKNGSTNGRQVTYAALKRPVKPLRAKYKTEIRHTKRTVSEATPKHTRDIVPAYAAMRSSSAEDLFSGGHTKRKPYNFQRQSMQPISYIHHHSVEDVTARHPPLRRAKSMENIIQSSNDDILQSNLTLDSNTDEGVVYSVMCSPSKEINDPCKGQQQPVTDVEEKPNDSIEVIANSDSKDDTALNET